MTQPRVETDELGLPVVSYMTREIMDYTEAAKAPRRQIIAAAIALLFFNLMVFAFSSNFSDSFLGFVIIFSIIIVIYLYAFHKDMWFLKVKSPAYEDIENTISIGSYNGRVIICYASRGIKRGFPYDRSLTFTVGRKNEWFESDLHTQWAIRNNVENPYVIVARDVDGALRAVATNVGSHAYIAHIHYIITESYITNFESNWRIINRVIKSNADNTELAEFMFPDKPTTL